MAFLKNKDLFDKFKSKLPSVRFLDHDGIDKEFIESYNKNAPEWSNQPDNRTPNQLRWFQTYITRDLSEEVLINIANSDDDEIILINNEQTAISGGWVEWSYIINLQENKLLVHGYIDKDPIVIFDLDNLPEEEDFIKQCEGEEEEDEE